MNTKDKLALLRREMKNRKLDGYLQPVHDEYMNEYPPACNRRVEWLTGFSGSAGTAVVLKNKAALFVDGRYTLQAKAEADGLLFEQHNTAALPPEGWLAKQRVKRIGYDAKLYARGAIRRLERALKGMELVAVPNVVDAVWDDRPLPPASKLFIHDIQYSGQSSAEKRKAVAARIGFADADAAIISTPDAVCWLLNIRARDVENTPLLLAPLILYKNGKAQLFVDSSRCDAGVKAHLGKDVTLKDPSQLEKTLLGLGKKHILCDAQTLPLWYIKRLEKARAHIVEGEDPCVVLKAQKNAVELKGIYDAHVRDGAAIVRLLCWLDAEIDKNRAPTEIDIAAKLLSFRKKDELFVEPSFPTIAGSGANGAIVHYRSNEKTNRAVQKGELLLLDSGGQYPSGTTDITRTIPIGAPSAEHKEHFTRVLKGHIAIATARFPLGTNGAQLDALARQYLWQAALDYDHGTGHGVGCFLGVHEGPQRIGKRGGDARLLPGMIISNEPGYYKDNEYGIRIENLVTVVEWKEYWLAFETVTCAPIDTRLVEASMLAPEEKTWLNSYHAWVAKQLMPLLAAAERDWLKERCAAL